MLLVYWVSYTNERNHGKVIISGQYNIAIMRFERATTAITFDG